MRLCLHRIPRMLQAISGARKSTMKIRTRLAAVVILLGAAAPHAWSAEQQTKLFIAQGAISNDVTPMWFAKDRGIFRKYGLEIDNVFIIAGRAAQAMLAGHVPVGLMGPPHFPNGVPAGGNLTMILGMKNRLDYLFVARPGIKSGA